MVDQVNIDSSKDTPQPTLEETAAAMGIDPSKVDQNAQEQTASPKILDKFTTQEDLVKAYQELEKKLSQRNVEADPAERTEQEVEEEVETEAEEGEQDEGKTAEELAKEATDKAGLDLNALSEKFWTNGEKLDDTDYEALEKANYPRQMVDQFIEGQKAIVQLQRQSVFNTVGGEEKYGELLEFGRSNFTEAEIKAFNRATESSDMDVVINAVAGLKARYDATVGFEPTRSVEGTTRRAAADRYESVAQMTKDMAKPEYQKDPAFRAKVQDKLARSDIF